MSLHNNRAFIIHLEVIELLHDIQFTACIRDPKLGLERSPHVLAIIKRHIGFNNVIPKNRQQSSPEQPVSFLENLLLGGSKLSLRLAKSDVIAVHVLKPENCSH